MNIIISFTGLGSSPDAVPYPLRRLAGSTILGHILVHLLDLPFKKLTLILDEGEDLVQRWAEKSIPGLELQTMLARNSKNPLAALNECRAMLDSGPLLFVSGNFIAEADFLDLISAAVDGSLLIQSEQDDICSEELQTDEDGYIKMNGVKRVRWAGSCWFRSGMDVSDAVQALKDQDDYCLKPLLSKLRTRGLRIATQRADYCLDTCSVPSMLYANARLLRLNHGTQDAIERSYAEDFTVLPPVFLHDTAVIENSVIGPFVNLEANASVRNSIVRNTLIGPGAHITEVVLDNSLIGENAVIEGKRSTIITDDGAVVKVHSIAKEQ